MYGWGGNSDGQLGTGSIGRHYTILKQLKIPETSRIVQVASGFAHTLFLTGKGYNKEFYNMDR